MTTQRFICSILCLSLISTSLPLLAETEPPQDEIEQIVLTEEQAEETKQRCLTAHRRDVEELGEQQLIELAKTCRNAYLLSSGAATFLLTAMIGASVVVGPVGIVTGGFALGFYWTYGRATIRHFESKLDMVLSVMEDRGYEVDYIPLEDCRDPNSECYQNMMVAP
jgi:hypothetical protein